MVLVVDRFGVDTVEFELHISFVVVLGQLKIEPVLFYKGFLINFLTSLVLREFPIDDAYLSLVSENQVESFKVFNTFFPHPLLRVHYPVSVRQNLFPDYEP